jgi:hypothetical protein
MDTANFAKFTEEHFEINETLGHITMMTSSRCRFTDTDGNNPSHRFYLHKGTTIDYRSAGDGTFMVEGLSDATDLATKSKDALLCFICPLADDYSEQYQSVLVNSVFHVDKLSFHTDVPMMKGPNLPFIKVEPAQ